MKHDGAVRRACSIRRLTFLGLLLWWAAVAALLMAPGAARAQGTQPVYTDTLQGTWQDWSWATTGTGNAGNGSPVHTGEASLRVDAGPYQALYLHHDGAIDTTPYGNLTFWIHGGPAGGQQLKVQATLDGQPQAEYDLPPLLPGAWQQFSVSLALLGAAGKPDLDGFWIQNTANASIPTFYVDDIALTPPQGVAVAVDAGRLVRPMDDRFAGINLKADDPRVADQAEATAQVLGPDNLDMRTVRIPGGSDADRYHWETAALVDGMTGKPTLDPATGRPVPGVSVAQFARVAEAAGAQLILTLNYGSGTPNEAAALIAYANGRTDDGRALGTDENGRDWGKVSDWARLRAATPLAADDGKNVLRAAHPQPFGVKLVEVGNECWGNTWECDLHGGPYTRLTGSPWDASTYAAYAARFMQMVRAVDPSVRVGVVATYDDQYNYWNRTMLTALGRQGAYPDFVVQHWYPQGPHQDQQSDAGLFATNAQWPVNAAHLQAQIATFLMPPAPVEMVVTENNSVYSDPGKQTVSLTNGLYLADSIGHALQTSYRGVLVWDLRDYPNTQGNATFGPPNNDPSLDGWRTVYDAATNSDLLFGDYGVLRTDFGADNAYHNTYYPSYHVLTMLKHFARGGDAIVSASSDDPRLSAYAARRADGSLSLLLINTDKSAQLQGNIAVTGFAPRGDGVTYTYGYFQDRTEDPQSSFYGVFPPGVAQAALTGAAPTFTYAIPPYSATVLSLPPMAGTSFSAGWHFFSVPMDYPDTPPGALLADAATLAPFSGLTLLVWDPAHGAYVATPAAPADRVRLGRGYWARFPGAVTLAVAGAPADPTSDFAVPLAAGWNQVGDPFTADVTLGSLKVRTAGGDLTFARAAGAGLLGFFAYGYDPALSGGRGGYVGVWPGDPLRAGQGYWLYAGRALTLLFPHPAQPQARVPPAGSRGSGRPQAR
ncbi:MAG: hypothetical protein JO250_20855 [Armatimonadetes bacterium]|nr:hypothetical protein [Armatimonadota bacterium]